jgi:hypothetical protein
MQHEEYKELVALEAVGSLALDEASSLAEHLDSCDECRNESAALRDAAAALVYTIEPVAPPEYLRDRVLEGVRASDSVLPFRKTSVSKASNGAAVGVGGRSVNERPSPNVKIGTWGLIASRPPLMFGAIAASIIIVVLAVTLAILGNRNQELVAEVARLSQSLQKSQDDLLLAQREAERVAEISAIISDPGAPITLLAGTEVAPGASARLIVDAKSGRALLATSGLPPAPAGKAYQLWYIAGGKPAPGLVFKPDAHGDTVLSDRVPDAGRQATIFAVTLEPEGGVSSPTGSMFLKGAAS